MIKVTIIDADTPLGGELLRLLVNHPDVDITGLVSRRHAGEGAATVHHGLIGETSLRFCSEIPSEANALFFCGDQGPDISMHSKAKQGELKIFDLSRNSYMENKTSTAVPAISEIFRKPLVRGASETRILSPLENALLISLFPLARNLLLSSPLEVEVETSEAVMKDLNPKRASELAERLLQGIQQSFSHNVSFKVRTTGQEGRCLRIKTKLGLSMPIKDLKPLYEEVYDDHNFTFLTSAPIGMREVEGTNKCLISLTRFKEGEVEVEAVCDARMRGAAGEAVLAMNLMFGLYERTGLQLKVSVY